MPVGKILYQSLQWKSLQFFTAFVVNIVFARVLHSIVAGEFYSLVYLLSLIISFFTLGLDISLNYYLSRKEMNGSTARRIIMAVTIPALAISLSLLWLFHPSRYTHLGLSWLLLLSGLHIAGGLLTSLVGALFTAAGKNHVPARIGFVANMLLAGVSLYCSGRYAGTPLIDALFVLYFVFSFGQGVLLYILSCRLSFVAVTAATLHLTRIIRFSFFAFLTNFIFFMAGRLYVYMLPYYLSPYDQGNYIQAYKLVEYMGLALSFMYYPLIALVAGQGRERLKDALLLLVRLSNTVVFSAAVIVLIAGGWLFPFVFGPSFDRMYGIFACFIPGLFAVCSSGFFTAWYFGSGHIRYNFISACIQLLTMPLFFFLLTGSIGAKGAALGFSLSSLLSLAYDLWIFRRYFRYTPGDMLLIRKSDWKILWGFVRRGRGFFLPSQRQ